MYPGYNFLQSPMNNLGYLQQLQQMRQMQQGQQMSPLGQPSPSQPQMPSMGASPTLGQDMMQPQKAPEHSGGGMSPLMALSPMLGLMQGHPGAAMFGLSPALGFARMLGAFK